MFTKLIFLASLVLNTVALHLRGTPTNSDTIHYRPYITRHSLKHPIRPSLNQQSYYNLTREVDLQQRSQDLTANTDSSSLYYQ